MVVPNELCKTYIFLKKDVQKLKEYKNMTELEKIKENEKSQINIEYYSNTLQAWYTTRMEKDKSILTISSVAIGLLVTFLNNYGMETQLDKFLYIIAIGGFLIAIISAIWIFTQNANYLQNIIQDDTTQNDPTLNFLDIILNSSFIVGIIFTILISAISIPNKTKDNNMEKKVQQQTTISNESLNKASILNPTKKDNSIIGSSTVSPAQNKSLNGANKLKPKDDTPKDNETKK